MQIALTKKLAEAMNIKPVSAKDTDELLFSWTANWTNTFHKRKEDMIIMVNNATRFTVLIYGVKKGQFNDITMTMTNAIRNTLLAMNLNTEMVDEYLQQAGEIEFIVNHDRQRTAWVNRQGSDAAFTVGDVVNESGGRLKFNDILGHRVSRMHVNLSNNHVESYIPAEKMRKALSELTGKIAYKYRAFELLITLDLEQYKAVRRLIVPADIEFTRLHSVIQRVFSWKNYHIHDFSIFDEKSQERIVSLVMSEEELSYDSEAILETGHKLSEYFPKYTHMLYTYDMGDSWEHDIELIKEIEEYNEESPYLLEAVGQTPPEDVGGVGGYLEFLEIMNNPNHPSYVEMKEWAGYWSPELREWDTRPKVIH